MIVSEINISTQYVGKNILNNACRFRTKKMQIFLKNLGYRMTLFFCVDRNIFGMNHLMHVDGLPLECFAEDSFLVAAILKILMTM
jgi:hypothetical protein